MNRITTSCTALLLLLSSELLAQEWQFVQSMAGERRMHTATLLDRGRVLVTGGTNRDHRAIAACEIFDFRTLRWTSAPPMSTPRERHTATLLADGRVVVIAGNTTDNSSNTVTASIEIFDPTTDAWSPAGALLTRRQNHTATLLADGTILVTGGFREDGVRFLADCEIYDPVTMTSRSATPLPRERMDHQALLLNDGRVLVTGGRIGGWNGEYLTRADLYDPATSEWTTIDPMFESRIAGFSLAQFSDSTVLVAGGRKGPEESTAGSELLDVRFQQWRTIDTMRLPVTWHAGAMLANDRFLVTGGFTDAVWQSPNIVRATSTCEWYDRAAKTWYYAPQMNMERSEHTMIYVQSRFGDQGMRELVMVMGGITGPDAITNTVEILDVSESAMAEYARSQQPSGRISFEASARGGVTVVGNGGESPSLFVETLPNSLVRLELYGSDGRHVRTLVDRIGDGEALRVALPRELAGGAYLVRLQRGAESSTAKVSVTR
jgi:hypothetical protein